MTSGTAPATPSEHHGHRAFRPGARRALLTAAVLAIFAAAVLVVVLAPGGGGNAVVAGHRVTPGKLPAWLPKISNTAPKVELATPAKPILEEEQGYTVRAKLPQGSADVTAVGPQFPAYITNYAQSNMWPAGKLVPSTFFVTFAAVRGTVPISAADFSVLTDTGQIVRAKLKMKAGKPVPSSIHTGQQVTIEVVTRTVEGQGSIRWGPQTPHVLVGWLYQLELD
jgi:hypothetical protein